MVRSEYLVEHPLMDTATVSRVELTSTLMLKVLGTVLCCVLQRSMLSCITNAQEHSISRTRSSTLSMLSPLMPTGIVRRQDEYLL